jgi:hypothetical protein
MAYCGADKAGTANNTDIFRRPKRPLMLGYSGCETLQYLSCSPTFIDVAMTSEGEMKSGGVWSPQRRHASSAAESCWRPYGQHCRQRLDAATVNRTVLQKPALPEGTQFPFCWLVLPVEAELGADNA